MKDREGERVILVGRIDSQLPRINIGEFKALAEAAGYKVVGILIQKRYPDSRFNIGSGKVKELKELISKLNAEKVIFYNQLSPNQVFNLQEELGVDVIDRFQLILEIFARHAGSKEAKLQIELAKLKYELPRIRELVRRARMKELPGISRGPGGYQVDVYYRAVRRRIAHIMRELEKIRKQKQIQRKARFTLGIPLVVLTGYTNAGKTTLFNRLARESKIVSSAPFSTLSTTTRLINFKGYKFLLSDTIGFIEDLPPLLIEAFYTTLEELIYADLILLVVDISEEIDEIKRKIDASMKILSEIGVLGKPIILVLNKIDKISNGELIERVEKVLPNFKYRVAISATKGYNIDRLCEIMVKLLPKVRIFKVALPVEKLPIVFSKFNKLRMRVIDIRDRALIELEVPHALMDHVQNYISGLGGHILAHATSGSVTDGT
ncbi:MAG: GTPase HflX [Thermoprotei archaeon]|nr:MAG: GTPase HflX [Thermoprotei archaeon]RLF20378.1 MAG: GTPase HflX [Thermoprotei archaeon]